MSDTALRVMCVAHKKDGTPCGKWAIKGATVCRSHGGASGHVKARAAVRAEVMSWGFTDKLVDPGETLLRLVAQSAARAERYAQEIDQMVEEEPSLREALIGETWVATEHGKYKSGEYIRGLAVLEAQERDRLAGFATKAIAAGLAERSVRLAEKQGELMVAMVAGALADAGLSPDDAAKVKKALAIRARELNP